MKIIAVSGVARAGKDTISDGLVEVLKDMNPSLKIMRVSFAENLKMEMTEFLVDNFAINPFNADGEEKELIRPLLVAYGKAKRNQTKGRYWVDGVDKKIKEHNPDVVIISDLRFAEEKQDELFWLREKGGKLIHVSRYVTNTKLSGDKEFIPPANQEEAKNDPILKENADFIIQWETSSDEKDLKEKTKEYCEKFYYENISLFS